MINRRRIWQLLADAGLVGAAWWLAFQLRFDHGPPVYYRTLLWQTILLVVVIKVAIFVASGVYSRFWRYVSVRDIWVVTQGVVFATVAADLTVYFASPVHGVRLPRSIAVLDFLLTLAFVTGSRLLARTVFERPVGGFVSRGRQVLVVGAGDAGQIVVREMLKSPARGFTPIGLVDDDPAKKGPRIHGVRVLGAIADLPHLIRDNGPDEILIAIPSAPGELRQRVVDLAGDVPVKTLPGLIELIAGDADLARQIRPIQVEDVLGREQIEVDLRQTATYLAGKTVLVTGAGGSIGAELCRQIARVEPAKLVLVDQAETPLFEIERELVHERGFTASAAVLADAGNRQKMRQVFEAYRPAVVFHAAAYKHVPMMESNPLASVRNNPLATKVVADVAAEFGAERFVLISTDKAVRPKTVMGQTKTLCEWIVEAYGARADVTTRFVAVRFGNVLNSNGSVVPIFRRQIERGGPVTVTSEEMTRFFMTIPEAVSLVVQAGAIGGRGQVFVLDMGEPVRIMDLAQNMIRLSGKREEDVPIKVVGVRPGEKLHEELFEEGESVETTAHPKILRASRASVDPAWLEDELAELERLVEAGETLETIAKLGAMVGAPRLLEARAPSVNRDGFVTS